ncbi:hypothetical protein [Aeromicrobium sp. UC242_57]|uniref:hypothetical protein n=1 Tax=Aeromicrobium sp. UC242_57 TaxID=3374624 RepID=UPI0037A85091
MAGRWSHRPGGAWRGPSRRDRRTRQRAAAPARGDAVDHVVAVDAVTVLHSAQRRADSVTAVGARLGWGYVFRALREAGEEIRIRLLDGTARDGTVDVVGQDFVRLRSEAGRLQIVVWRSIAVVSART